MRVLSNVYVSSGVPGRFLDEVTKAGGKLCVNVFSDKAYGRSSLTLAGEINKVMQAAQDIVSHSVQNLSLQNHVAQHPRIGVADHVLLAPIQIEQLGEVEDAARGLAERIAAANPGLKTAAYSRATPLAELRRHTPYFTDGALAGPLDPAKDRTAELENVSLFGPDLYSPELGMTCVGAARWVTNFNVPLPANTTLAEAKRIANSIRSRSKSKHALPAVQAVGLAHADGVVEIGCNLLNVTQTSTAKIEEVISALLTNPAPVQGYVIGKPWEMLVELANRD
mmetsp:Transcript_12724/g.20657  ORF Transcript_12724/g.20657 Transcript_12724/m.20657 type:complete len:281 (+) Transcript_12724:143-985(+)|eukprot:CAMPEP_0171515158 /NCGR_PEP_ID=MMETSP0959-20130129/3281_1 /TAXON_ID=87120 /ORGANISM="Aurantiochytrium limacinum, Strain ATCCMYA-1381" /LENGTH=280 /DNA_ID=CAMNT_0012053637 /DNA_START=136 /DNA_END=978 /DNA_ORIENTATION=-